MREPLLDASPPPPPFHTSGPSSCAETFASDVGIGIRKLLEINRLQRSQELCSADAGWFLFYRISVVLKLIFDGLGFVQYEVEVILTFKEYFLIIF